MFCNVCKAGRLMVPINDVPKPPAHPLRGATEIHIGDPKVRPIDTLKLLWKVHSTIDNRAERQKPTGPSCKEIYLSLTVYTCTNTLFFLQRPNA